MTTSVQLSSFKVGEEAEINFKAPDKGKVRIDFKTSKTGDETAMRQALRYDFGGDVHQVNLNTYYKGAWETAVHPVGFDFTAGVLIQLRVVATPAAFDIYCSGKFIASYQYRDGLDSASVKSIGWTFEDNGASVMPELKSIKIKY